MLTHQLSRYDDHHAANTDCENMNISVACMSVTPISHDDLVECDTVHDVISETHSGNESLVSAHDTSTGESDVGSDQCDDDIEHDPVFRMLQRISNNLQPSSKQDDT